MIQIDTESTAVLDTAQGTATLESAENEILYCAGQMARSILRIGRALKVIRDGELYKSGGFESFAAYLDARAFSGWSIGQTQGYKYVAVFERYGNRLEVFGCSNLEVLYILKDTPDDELEKLAEKVHMNPNYFSEFFGSVMNCTVSAYIIRRRLKSACLRLTTTEDSIIKIASDSGFDNVSYFNRTFKKHLGMTPGEYRRGHSKAHK